MFNERIVRAIKKEIVERYNYEFLLSKLTDDKKYVYDNPRYNFYFIKFNNVHIYLTGGEDHYNALDDIRIEINDKNIEIIFKWLNLNKYNYNFSVETDKYKIQKIYINYLKYKPNHMKNLFKFLDFMKLFYKKYDNIGEII